MRRLRERETTGSDQIFEAGKTFAPENAENCISPYLPFLLHHRLSRAGEFRLGR